MSDKNEHSHAHETVPELISSFIVEMIF